MNRRWLIKRTNPDYTLYLSHAASISPVLAQVLINRGIRTPGEIKDFLSAGTTGLADPFDIPGMSAAVARIKAAFLRNETVLVHGDYDTDGLTATSIMVHTLRAMGMNVHYFIPNRMTHGYGFNPPSVDVAAKLGATLIITVDCGITAFDAVTASNQRGIDVIVTDHHEPARQSAGNNEFLLPDAVAVVNPKLNTLSSALAMLSGAGIAFKVAQALALDDTLPVSGDDSLSLLDLAALGTLADVVPLTGENRIILKEGMRQLQSGRRSGIRSLIEVSGLRDRELRAGLLSFSLVPRINASGRIGDSGEIISLFLSDSDEETFPIAEHLDRINAERQKIEEETYQEALAQLKKKGHDAAVVLAGKGWHAGVIGIVASRIMEACYRPTFILTLEDGIAKGSARSIPAFDLYRGLSACSDLLISFGGHRQAAGVKLREDDIERFEEKMNAVVRDTLQADDFISTIEIDTEVALRDVSIGLVRELSLLEPMGSGNPEPLLGARRLDVLNPKVVGKNHLKMKLKQRALSFDAIGFDMGGLIDHLGPSIPVDAAFVPTINEWNGNRYLQLNLRGCRPSG
jgi:single-stranded-DNA-specific exonuclease